MQEIKKMNKQVPRALSFAYLSEDLLGGLGQQGNMIISFEGTRYTNNNSLFTPPLIPAYILKGP